MGQKELEEIFVKQKSDVAVRKNTLFSEYPFSKQSFDRSLKKLEKRKKVLRFVQLENENKVFYIWTG